MESLDAIAKLLGLSRKLLDYCDSIGLSEAQAERVQAVLVETLLNELVACGVTVVDDFPRKQKDVS